MQNHSFNSNVTNAAAKAGVYSRAGKNWENSYKGNKNISKSSSAIFTFFCDCFKHRCPVPRI